MNTTYSPAAKEHASKNHARDHWCDVEDLVAAAFDAGFAKHLDAQIAKPTVAGDTIHNEEEHDALPVGSVTVANGRCDYKNHTKRSDGWYVGNLKQPRMDFPRSVVSVPPIVVTPEPELIEYTDSRAVAGARVRLVRESTLVDDHDYKPGQDHLSVKFITAGNAREHKMYLLSEAPNPDADVLEALMRADCFREEMPVYVSRLEELRRCGVKVAME